MKVRDRVVPAAPRVPGTSLVQLDPGNAVANPPITRFTAFADGAEDEVPLQASSATPMQAIRANDKTLLKAASQKPKAILYQASHALRFYM